jgi:hypothetical protein
MMPPAFALDNIIEGVLVDCLTLGEGEYQFFLTSRKDKTFERPFAPDDFVNVHDKQPQPLLGFVSVATDEGNGEPPPTISEALH